MCLKEQKIHLQFGPYKTKCYYQVKFISLSVTNTINYWARLTGLSTPTVAGLSMELNVAQNTIHSLTIILLYKDPTTSYRLPMCFVKLLYENEQVNICYQYIILKFLIWKNFFLAFLRTTGIQSSRFEKWCWEPENETHLNMVSGNKNYVNTYS